MYTCKQPLNPIFELPFTANGPKAKLDDVNYNKDEDGRPHKSTSNWDLVSYCVYFKTFIKKMSSPLVARTASICRSTFRKPAVFSGIRFSSSETKDVQHLEKQPVLSVENLSGAPGKFFC